MASDTSSEVSQSQIDNVTTRDRGQCVVCGKGHIVHVAHIIARGHQSDSQLSWIRGLSPQSRAYEKDEVLNLITLCPSHHQEYEAGYYTLIPCQADREALLSHESSDFNNRQAAVDQGKSDPGWSLPEWTYEYPSMLSNPRLHDYIPLDKTPLTYDWHMPAWYDNTVYTFDNQDVHTPHLRPLVASPLALILRSSQELLKATRLNNQRTNLAVAQTAELVGLYGREAPQSADRTATVRVTDSTDASIKRYHNTADFGGHSGITNIAKETLLDAEMDGASSFQPSTDGDSKPVVAAEGDEGALHDETDAVLDLYRTERAVTHEQLLSRVKVPAVLSDESWRFSSSEEACSGF